VTFFEGIEFGTWPQPDGSKFFVLTQANARDNRTWVP